MLNKATKWQNPPNAGKDISWKRQFAAPSGSPLERRASAARAPLPGHCPPARALPEREKFSHEKIIKLKMFVQQILLHEFFDITSKKHAA